MPIFALTDCNNFFVSCERVFNPKLRGKPVIVLSNNDGCAIARSEEAKALGIKMGVPVFEIRDLIRTHDVQVFSSNFALYADMSRRVMTTLSQFAPDIEIYSIDEAFIDLSSHSSSSFGNTDLTEYGRMIRAAVIQQVGIPVSVGIAETKTLAKIANRIAKKSQKANGVLNLTGSPYIEVALERTEVGDVWGIGRKYAKFLKAYGINNALQLRNADDGFIRAKMGIVGIRLVEELRGNACYTLDDSPESKKSIRVSRSFKRAIENPDDLHEAVASFAASAAAKLRKQKSVAGMMSVFIMTNRFDKERFYTNSEAVRLLPPTNNTPEMIRYAHQALENIFRNGMGFKRAGVLLYDLSSDDMVQTGLFDCRDRKKSERLMSAIDSINERIGDGVLKFAAEGIKAKPVWKTVFDRKSPAYTTDWGQLPVVR